MVAAVVIGRDTITVAVIVVALTTKKQAPYEADENSWSTTDLRFAKSKAKWMDGMHAKCNAFSVQNEMNASETNSVMCAHPQRLWAHEKWVDERRESGENGNIKWKCGIKKVKSRKSYYRRHCCRY